MCKKLRDGNPCPNDQFRRPKTLWEDNVLGDVRGMNVNNCKKIARNRDRWEKVVERTITLHRL
jgi:hypothetical protein